MRAAEPDRGASDGRHPDELEGARGEGGEGRGERRPAPGRRARWRRRSSAAPRCTSRSSAPDARRRTARSWWSCRSRRRGRPRRPARCPGPRVLRRTPAWWRPPCPTLVARQGDLAAPHLRARGASCRGSGRNTRSGRAPSIVRTAAGSGNGRPCMPSRPATAPEPSALLRAGDDGQRSGRVVTGRGEGVVDGQQVVAVDLHSAPAESPGPTGVHAGVTVGHRRTALSQAVDVDDDDEVAESVVGGVLEGLPDRALRPSRCRRRGRRPALDCPRADAATGRCRRQLRRPGRASRWPPRPRAGSGADDPPACCPESRASAARRRRSPPWP